MHVLLSCILFKKNRSLSNNVISLVFLKKNSRPFVKMGGVLFTDFNIIHRKISYNNSICNQLLYHFLYTFLIFLL